MKTAKQTLDGMLGKNEYPTYTPSAMIEFAQKHVTAALKANHKLHVDSGSAATETETINSYLLTNIK